MQSYGQMSSDRGTFVHSGKAFGEVVPMEKDIREEYAGSMLGFSWKRFLMTLGLSVGVWLISAFIQAYMTFAKYLGTFSSGCQITGYPLDLCKLRGPDIPAIFVIFINIFFWFWVIHLFWNWFEKRHN